SGNTSGHKKWQDKGKMIKSDGVEKAKGAIENGGKGVEVNLAYQDEKNDSFDIDNFDIDSIGVDNPGVPEDPNDITHLDVGDFFANE
ncbi:hypothetical protein Tco_1073927, partial [Tanacetum coccineum]